MSALHERVSAPLAPSGVAPSDVAPSGVAPSDVASSGVASMSVAASPVHPRGALAMGWASGASVMVGALISAVMFTWPLFINPGAGAGGHNLDAPYFFMAILPLVLGLVMAQLGEGGMDSKTLAMLGILAGVGAALRPLGAGVAGIETMFFLLILAGRVFGPAFGMCLGTLSLLASALLTGGVGPWLPFQMMAGGWVTLGAGLLPRRVRGRGEIAMLCAYGAIASFVFGAAMNMWFWPFLTDASSALGFAPGAGFGENLVRFVRYGLVTSFTWDAGRAVTTAVLIATLGHAVMVVLRRAARRAGWRR